MYRLPCIALVFLLALTTRVTTRELIQSSKGIVGKPGVINCTALTNVSSEKVTEVRVEWRGLFFEWKKFSTAIRNLSSGISGTSKFADDDTWATVILRMPQVKCSDHQQHYSCHGKFKSEGDLPGASPWEMEIGNFEGAVQPEIRLESILPSLIEKKQVLEVGAQVEITYRVVLGFTGEKASVLWRINNEATAIPIADEDPRISTMKKAVPGKECVKMVITSFRFAAADGYHNCFLEVFVLNSKQGLLTPLISEVCDPKKTICALTPVLKVSNAGCSPGFYGEKCDLECNMYCVNRICSKLTGECIVDCGGAHYGENCDKNCHCAKGTPCLGMDGECPHGCAPGYTGRVCRNPCKSGSWGLACSRNCNPDCRNGCSVETGECLPDDPSKATKYYLIVVSLTLVFLILMFAAYYILKKKKKNGQLLFFKQ